MRLNIPIGGKGKNAMNLSIVIPYFGCDGSLEDLCESLSSALSQVDMDSEVIFILDGPNGGSWANLRKITDKYGYLSYRLTRNFGQHAATKAGLSLSKGSMVIVMDCDLQDPPSLIPELVANATEDVDVVFARRKGRYDGFARQVARQAANLFFKLVYPKGFDLDIGSYLLLKRAVVNEILAIKDITHIGLMVNWLNFPSVSVNYHRELRKWGQSNYNFKKLIEHGVEALSFNLSYFFRKILFVSVVGSFISTIIGLIAFVRTLTSTTYAGWVLIFILISISFSIILSLLALVGFIISDKLSNINMPTFLIRKD